MHNLSHNSPFLSHNLLRKFRTISIFKSHPIRRPVLNIGKSNETTVFHFQQPNIHYFCSLLVLIICDNKSCTYPLYPGAFVRLIILTLRHLLSSILLGLDVTVGVLPFFLGHINYSIIYIPWK